MKAIIVSVATIALVAGAGAQSARAQLEAQSKLICAAMMKRDVAEFTKIMKSHVTSDFKYVENGQTENFDTMVAGMKMGLGMMSRMKKVEDKIIGLKISGKVANAETKHMMVGMTKAQGGKEHEMSFSGITADVFRNEGGQWKMASMTWKSQTMAMDGKPMNPGQMGGK